MKKACLPAINRSMSRVRIVLKRRMLRLGGLILFIIFIIFIIPSPALAGKPEEECHPQKVSGERDSRPAACNICHTTDLLTPSCTTAFNVYKELPYLRMGLETIKKSWGGKITVDPSEVTIPFVGKKRKGGRTSAAPCRGKTCNPYTRECDSPCVAQLYTGGGCVCIDPGAGEVGENEGKYLADYFEGTNEYYKNYGNQNTITNYQGILRKLTPFEYQNQLKKDLINRAKEETIHNYKVEYIGRLCWDTPFWMDAAKFILKKLSWLDLPDIGHYCLFEDFKNRPGDWAVIKGYQFGSWITNWIPKVDLTPEWLDSLQVRHSYKEGFEVQLSELANHTPPEPTEENYQEKFLKWKNEEDGKWYRLWQATPMLTREDTPGEIRPYLGLEHPEDTFEILNEEAMIEKVPHLARLYEGSQLVNQILIPYGFEIKMPTTPPIPETTPPYACLKEKYIIGPEGDDLCCQPIPAQLTAWEEFKNPYYSQCAGSPTPRFDCTDPGEKEVSRGFGVNLLHPYLDQIWGYTGYPSGGVFNIFRPYDVPPFEDIDAVSNKPIKYRYGAGDVSPAEGYFYFPHLGGVQLSKEWVVTKTLWPYESEQK